MRAHRTFLGFAIMMGCGITLQSTASSQEYRGTWEQQMACTPDVWRLCGAQVPDVDRIVACLRRNTSQLSGRCRAVFEQGDNAPRRGADRDYGQRRYDRGWRYDRAMVRSVTTETTGRGAMTMTTNSRLWGEHALPHQSPFRRDRWNHPALQDSLATSIRLKAG
jgi:hypothetical protein